MSKKLYVVSRKGVHIPGHGTRQIGEFFDLTEEEFERYRGKDSLSAKPLKAAKNTPQEAPKKTKTEFETIITGEDDA